MRETIRLEDMRLFAGVAEAQSFSGAARSLGIPKQTISRRIAELERALGVGLMNRTTRRLKLTDVGAAYRRSRPRSRLRPRVGGRGRRRARRRGSPLTDVAAFFEVVVRTVHLYDVGQALVALPDGRHVLVDTGDNPHREQCDDCAEKHAHLIEKLRGDLAGAPIDLVWITHQHGDVVLTTTGDGAFVRH